MARSRSRSRSKERAYTTVYVISYDDLRSRSRSTSRSRKNKRSSSRGKRRDCSKGRYATRKSPCDSATDYRVGKVMMGMDGEMWKVVKASNGVKRWQKL